MLYELFQVKWITKIKNNMKTIRRIFTFIIIVYIAIISDNYYAIHFKPIIYKLTGFEFYFCCIFCKIATGAIGWALGTNTNRISNFIWNKEDC